MSFKCCRRHRRRQFGRLDEFVLSIVALLSSLSVSHPLFLPLHSIPLPPGGTGTAISPRSTPSNYWIECWPAAGLTRVGEAGSKCWSGELSEARVRQ